MAREDDTCAATTVAVNGIEGVRLENEWLSAVILVGKGTDIWELTYKPLNLQLLMKTRAGLSLCEGRDLRKNRLMHYAEGYPGGGRKFCQTGLRSTGAGWRLDGTGRANRPACLGRTPSRRAVVRAWRCAVG